MSSDDPGEVTALRQRIAELEHQLMNDPQTGCKSRFYLKTYFDEGKADGQFLLLVDLDDFKGVNDDYGYHVGDSLIAEIGNAFRTALAGDGFVARLGGDEFCIVPGTTDSAQIDALANTLVTAAARCSVRQGLLSINRRASIGCAYVAEGMSMHETIIKAEGALRSAKQNGKNQVVKAHDRDCSLPMREPTLEEIRLGLQREEFGYHVQPILTVDTLDVVGFEALLRWHRPNGEVLGPSQFLAKLTQYYDAYTWPPLAAANRIAEWATRDCGCTISFNVSAALLEKIGENGFDWVRQAIGDTPYDRVILDVAENVVQNQPNRVHRVMEQLREAGIRIALDDFGVGHSNLERLRASHVDFVKIDRRFVASSVRSERDFELLGGMVEIAHRMGAQTIAEGIETEEELEIVRRLGASFVQGFLTGKPKPTSAYAHLERGEASVSGMRKVPA